MRSPQITIDDEGVRRVLSDGTQESVAWSDLVEVVILTTDEGPFVEDVFFVLRGRNETGCIVPQGAPESPQLLERLQQLPGFDNAAGIKAMKSVKNASFVCWRR